MYVLYLSSEKLTGVGAGVEPSTANLATFASYLRIYTHKKGFA